MRRRLSTIGVWRSAFTARRRRSVPLRFLKAEQTETVRLPRSAFPPAGTPNAERRTLNAERSHLRRASAPDPK